MNAIDAMKDFQKSPGDKLQESFPKKGEVVYLEDLPDNVVIAPDAFKSITNVDVPLYLPDGTIGGKARVIEGDDEDSVLIEVESSNPIVASLFKADIIGLSLVHRIAQDAHIQEVDL